MFYFICMRILVTYAFMLKRFNFKEIHYYFILYFWVFVGVEFSFRVQT